MNELEKLNEVFRDHAESDERNFKEIKTSLKAIEGKLTPLTDAYAGVMFSRRFVMGLAGIVLAIGAIGAGMMWVVDWIRQKPGV